MHVPYIAYMYTPSNERGAGGGGGGGGGGRVIIYVNIYDDGGRTI